MIAAVLSLAPAAWGDLFVSHRASSGTVAAFNRTDTGNTAPIRTIIGGNTGLDTPIGLALAGSPTPAGIPTLSEWAQIGMAGLLVGGGLLAIRRNRQPLIPDESGCRPR